VNASNATTVRVSRAECPVCHEHASVTDFRFDEHANGGARCAGSNRNASNALARQIREDLLTLETNQDRDEEQLEELRASIARRKAMIASARKQLAVCERRAS